jgi:hypothetical protein
MDPRTIRALAKTAGGRSPKTAPLDFGRRTANYILQNGRKDLTPRQYRRRTHKLHRSELAAAQRAGGAR